MMVARGSIRRHRRMPIPNCGRYPAPRFTRPRRCAWDNGEIDRAAAALRARQARGPCRNREVGAVARGLLVGVDIDGAGSSCAGRSTADARCPCCRASPGPRRFRNAYPSRRYPHIRPGRSLGQQHEVEPIIWVRPSSIPGGDGLGSPLSPLLALGILRLAHGDPGPAIRRIERLQIGLLPSLLDEALGRKLILGPAIRQRESGGWQARARAYGTVPRV
jgi:hypothetical protein